MTREAFGAQFVGAAGYLNSPTYGLPPDFLIDELTRRIGDWQSGTLDVPSFDESVGRGRAGYADLVGVPVESVAMGGSVSAVLGLVAAAIPDGSRVVTLVGEFTSATFPFAAQAGRVGRGKDADGPRRHAGRGVERLGLDDLDRLVDALAS